MRVVDSAAGCVHPHSLCHPASVACSSLVDQEVTYGHLSFSAVDLAGAGQAAHVDDLALHQAHACGFVIVDLPVRLCAVAAADSSSLADTGLVDIVPSAAGSSRPTVHVPCQDSSRASVSSAPFPLDASVGHRIHWVDPARQA